MALLLILLRLAWLLAILNPIFCHNGEYFNWLNHSPHDVSRVNGDSTAYRSSKEDTTHIQRKISEIFNVPALLNEPLFGNTFKVQRSPYGNLSIKFDQFALLQQKDPFGSDSSSQYSAPDMFNAKVSDTTNTKKNWPLKITPFVADRGDCLEHGKSLCTEVRNYPDISQIETMLMRHLPNVQMFLDEDATVSPNISQRMNIDPYEESLCRSRESIIYPKLGETANSGWFFILNSQKYRQGVRVEECEQDGGKCKAFLTLPNKYMASCKQHYVYRSLVALTNDGKVISDHFKIPSCCKCILKYE